MNLLILGSSFFKIESILEVARIRRRYKRGNIFNGYRISIWDDGKSFGKGQKRWLHNTVDVLRATELYT